MGEKPSFQTHTVNGLIILYYRNLITYSFKRYTNARNITLALARRCVAGDAEAPKDIEALEKMKKTVYGYPLALVETIVYRDLFAGHSMGRIYNYGWRRKPVKLGDLAEALEESLVKITDIFTGLCARNDIDTQITQPIIEGLNVETGGL